MIDNDLDDPLAELFGGSATETAPRKPVTPPASYKAPTFDEPCSKCRGSGSFTGYSGRSFGACFACKGTGKKTFKTSRETRQANRTNAHARSERKAVTERAERDVARSAFEAANPEVMVWLHAAARRATETASGFDFPVQMLNALNRYGSLTEGQLAAVQRLIARDAVRSVERAERAASAPVVDVTKIESAFASARAAGKKKLYLRLDAFTVKPARKDPAILYVTEGEQYLGKIVGGRFVAVRECGPEREARVLAVCSDPLAAAKAYGFRTGSCSCCGRELTDPDSIALGIGPICAGKYGWGA